MSDASDPGRGSETTALATRPRRRRGASAATYEFRTVTLGRDATRSDARRLLTEEAEYGRWELATSSLYVGGERRVMLRRRIIRARNTLGVFD